MTAADDAIRILACDDSETADADLAAIVEYAENDGGPPLKLSGINGRIDNASAAITAGRRTACDVVLLDLVMPKTSHGKPVFAAPWIARALTSHYIAELRSRPPALVLWTSNPLKTAPCEVRAFMALGGRHVIDKQESVRKQVELIRGIVLLDERWEPAKDGLTNRERELLALLVEGRSHQTIANELVVAPKTVTGYVGDLRHKLGVTATDAQGAGPLRTAAERAGISWVPPVYLRAPDPGDPLSLAY